MTIKSINEPEPPTEEEKKEQAKKDLAAASQGVTKKDGDVSHETSKTTADENGPQETDEKPYADEKPHKRHR